MRVQVLPPHQLWIAGWMAMQLYAVRHTDDKQGVGFFWAVDKNELIWLVDQFSDVRDCEFQKIESSGGFGWGSPCPGIGVKRDWERSPLQKDSPAGQEIEKLMRSMEPLGSIEAFFYDDESEGYWTPLEGLIHIAPTPPPPKPRSASEILQAVKDDTRSAYGKVTVYFIRSGDHIKIGITAASAHERMKALATAHHEEMSVVATIRDADPALEEELHQRFAQYRKKREWFKAGVHQGFGFEQEPFASPFDQAVAAAQQESIDVSRGDSASAREAASLRSCATLICNHVRFRSFAKNASPEDMRNATRALAEAYGSRGLPLNPSTTGFTAKSSLMHGR